MYKALLTKEWLKTRRVFWVSLILSLLVAVYAVMQMRAFAATRGMEALWLTMIQKDVSFVGVVTFVPLFAGVAMGAAQMAPEMLHKRLKLTLQLPCPSVRLVAVMLGAGVLQLLAIFVLQAAVIAVYDASILHGVLVGRVMLTMLPWYMAGIIAYLFVAAICLEGTWAMRVVLALLGTAVVMLMYLRPDSMAAYGGMTAAVIIFLIIVTVLSFGSVARFKEGLQD